MNVRDLDLYQIAEEIQLAGGKWAELKQIADHKERFSKVLLSQLVLDFKNSRKEKTSQAELERMAYSSPKWTSYLKEWKEAEEAALKARIKYEAWQNVFVAKQDKEATERRLKVV